MRREIEDLVEKRKQQQETLKSTLDELGHLIENRGFFNRKKGEIRQKLAALNDDLCELMTGQDREWDAYNNNHSTMVFKSLQWKIEKLDAEYSHVKTLLANFITLEKSLQGLIDSLDQKRPPDEAAVEQLRAAKEQLSPYQYSDFEQRFRGDEAVVREKLQKYVPIFKDADAILDIGCGRGEFLELLQDQGKRAFGIDISESMLKIAEAKGLKCEKADALAHLKEKADDSLGGIFSAQVIEHLAPDYLRALLLEAFRVLKKDAPLVLETINPLCIFALSNIYFLDVSHQKPLHPEYMRYLLETCGFSAVKILYAEELQEERLIEISPGSPNAREFNTNVDRLNKILFSSPVYAVTGSKK